MYSTWLFIFDALFYLQRQKIGNKDYYHLLNCIPSLSTSGTKSLIPRNSNQQMQQTNRFEKKKLPEIVCLCLYLFRLKTDNYDPILHVSRSLLKKRMVPVSNISQSKPSCSFYEQTKQIYARPPKPIENDKIPLNEQQFTLQLQLQHLLILGRHHLHKQLACQVSVCQFCTFRKIFQEKVLSPSRSRSYRSSKQQNQELQKKLTIQSFVLFYQKIYLRMHKADSFPIDNIFCR